MYSVVLKVPVLLCEGGHSHCDCEEEGHTPRTAAERKEGVATPVVFCYFGKKHTTELQSPSDGSSSNVWDEALFVGSAVK